MAGVEKCDANRRGVQELLGGGRHSGMSAGLGTLGRGLVVAALVVIGLVLVPSGARAGSYIVAQCSPGVNTGAPDAAFSASSSHFTSFADCAQGAPGLEVNYGLNTGETGTRQGAYGAWVWTAPPGTYLTGGSTYSRLATQNGIHGYLAVSPDGGGGVAFETQNDDQGHAAGVPTGNWRFLVARLECTVPNEGERCAGAGSPHAYVKQVRMQLTDVAPPKVSIGGSLLSGQVLHGPQTLQVEATDEGAGLQSIHVAINGVEATGDDLSASCNPLPGNLTARMAPCPGSFAKTYALDTAKPPFNEGANSVSVCVYDYAQTGTPNSACESRELTVDNLCPGSPIGGGKSIAAGFGNGKLERTLPFRSRALIRGRLRDGSGNPVSGAQICIEGHTDLSGRPFHLIGTTTTNEAGGWTYKLGHGPSRIIRVAYRDGAFQTVTDLPLQMRARSTLHLSTHRTCIHRRIYFSGALSGPLAAHRVVVVRGTIPGSKRRFLIRRAYTDALGHFRVAYAFAAVVRLTRFAFWSVVPRQEGYPYVRGHSVARYIRVRPHECRRRHHRHGHRRSRHSR
jgi:hypothetical protein